MLLPVSILLLLLLAVRLLTGTGFLTGCRWLLAAYWRLVLVTGTGCLPLPLAAGCWLLGCLLALPTNTGFFDCLPLAVGCLLATGTGTGTGTGCLPLPLAAACWPLGCLLVLATGTGTGCYRLTICFLILLNDSGVMPRYDAIMCCGIRCASDGYVLINSM